MFPPPTRAAQFLAQLKLDKKLPRVSPPNFILTHSPLAHGNEATTETNPSEGFQARREF